MHGQNQYSFSSVIHGINPGSISVNIIDEHLVVVTGSICVEQLSNLLGEDGVNAILGSNKSVFNIFNKIQFIFIVTVLN